MPKARQQCRSESQNTQLI
jgi:hypothetical protein